MRGVPPGPLAAVTRPGLLVGRGKLNEPQRRARSHSRDKCQDPVEPLRARGASGDDRGALRDLCENCYVGTGSHVPRHKSRSCQDLGNPCHLRRRAHDCGKRNVCHWARDCPNRGRLGERAKREM